MMEDLINQIKSATTMAELRELRMSLEDFISIIDNRLKELEFDELYDDDDENEPWWNK